MRRNLVAKQGMAEEGWYEGQNGANGDTKKDNPEVCYIMLQK